MSNIKKIGRLSSLLFIASIGLTACTAETNLQTQPTTQVGHFTQSYYICQTKNWPNPDVTFLSRDGRCQTHGVFSSVKRFGPILPGTAYRMTLTSHVASYVYRIHIESGAYSGWNITFVSPVALSSVKSV
jgi:hypothetical protein